MLPISIEIKLITIVFLALMNMLLLKRKKNDKDTVQSYMLEGGNSHNVNNHDSKYHSDSLEVKYEYSQKFVDANKDLNSLFKNTENTKAKQAENLLFVRLQNSKKPLFSQKEKQESDCPLKIDEKSQEKLFQKFQPLPSKEYTQQSELNKKQNQDHQFPCNSNQQVIVPPLFIPMQEQHNEQQFHEIVHETKSDHKSSSKSFKQAPKTKPIDALYSQRKFTQQKFPFQLESESDSHTKKTEINLRKKEKSLCKNECSCCKISQTPRQTLKRCLQDLIFTTFQEMIDKDTIQQNYGHKKKKRSL